MRHTAHAEDNAENNAEDNGENGGGTGGETGRGNGGGNGIGNGRESDLRAFEEAYDAVLAQWPEATVTSTLPTRYGTTHLTSCGPPDAPPVVLLPGGGATATGWAGTATELARTHRVHVLDLIGDPGRSVASGPRIRTVEALMTWLDETLAALPAGGAPGAGEAPGAEGAPVPTPITLCGHSYGAWIALHYALHAPQGRLRRLVLLDPTQCFTGLRPAYVARALPMLLRPTARRIRAFLEWETAASAAPLDPAWLRLQERTADFPAVRPVTGPRPDPAALRTLTTPALLLLAGAGKAQDAARVARRAGELLPGATTEILPTATHHALPLAAPPGTNELISGFLAD
ncbi:alpha/beta hydrolase [Streptomyces sp. NPDC093085]|uniref:alpha/beta fold hydrolase n=1 Tax=Streptomyces sp. NPDC093085 TaxID=3155068 RepID=UPI00341F1F75